MYVYITDKDTVLFFKFGFFVVWLYSPCFLTNLSFMYSLGVLPYSALKQRLNEKALLKPHSFARSPMVALGRALFNL